LKKKIFITGVSSLIIKKLLTFLSPNEYEFCGITRQNISLENVKLIKASLKEIALYKSELESSHLVIHAAAITHTYTESEYFDVNFEDSKILIDISSKIEGQKFIYVSSKTATPQSGGYGHSKFETELYLKSYHKDFLIIRPSEIFGGGKNEGIDDFIAESCTKKLMICPVQIPTKLAPIFIDDVVSQLHEVVFRSQQSNQIITLQGNKEYSMFEIIQLCNNIKGINTLIIPIPKFLMFLIMHILKIFKLKIGIFPDQIKRLYSKKEGSFLPNSVYTSLEDYVRNKTF
jgi:nucleoside-diphosphate-sugar epimerase